MNATVFYQQHFIVTSRHKVPLNSNAPFVTVHISAKLRLLTKTHTHICCEVVSPRSRAHWRRDGIDSRTLKLPAAALICAHSNSQRVRSRNSLRAHDLFTHFCGSRLLRTDDSYGPNLMRACRESKSLFYSKHFRVLSCPQRLPGSK